MRKRDLLGPGCIEDKCINVLAKISLTNKHLFYYYFVRRSVGRHASKDIHTMIFGRLPYYTIQILNSFATYRFCHPYIIGKSFLRVLRFLVEHREQ